MPEHEELEVDQESVSGRAETLLRDPMHFASGIHSLCAAVALAATVPYLMTKLYDAWENPEHMLVNQSHRKEGSKLHHAHARVGKLQVN